LADGPTIQHSSQVALDGGMTVIRSLEGVRELRERGVNVPFMLMGYYNPILAFGVTRFVLEAVNAGANGFIIPDLPPEEAAALELLCQEHGMALSFLLAPNSTKERIRLVGEKSTGFTYLVSVTGITGARTALPAHLTGFVARVRQDVDTPLAVGFGISTPKQAGAVAAIADGVIVGSALIKNVDNAKKTGRDPARAAAGFVRELRAGITTRTLSRD
jgi:tryptophan synthase alpha chain